MSTISKSIGHLTRGNYLRLKNTRVTDSVGALSLTLADNGHRMRENLLQMFLVEIKQKPIISTNFKATTDFSTSVQKAFKPLVQQKYASTEKTIHWEQSRKKTTFGLGGLSRLPGGTSGHPIF